MKNSSPQSTPSSDTIKRDRSFEPFIKRMAAGYPRDIDDSPYGRRLDVPPFNLRNPGAPPRLPAQLSPTSLSSVNQTPGDFVDATSVHLSPQRSPSEHVVFASQGPTMLKTDVPRVETYSSSPSISPHQARAVESTNIVPTAVEQPLFHDWPTAEPPVIMNKPSLQNVVFKQPISVRFLKPPTPPPPGPVVIRERRPVPLPPLPPQIIRQRLPRARTPEPLVIRERPPTPPKAIKPILIEKVLPAPPRPPRQVIVERFHEPRRPRKLIFEKWLPYTQPKRRIILEKAADVPLRPPPRNIIIEYTRPQAFMLPEYKVEGVFQADPLTYTYSPYDGELKVVEKIHHLPPPPANMMSARVRNPFQTQQGGANNANLT